MRKTDESFEEIYNIKFSELDNKLTLRPSALVNYLQNISMAHSTNGGYDVNYFTENKTAWIILHWHLHIYELPSEEGTTLKISTWCKQFRRTQANREITVESPDGKLYCYASVRFVLVDTEKRKPKPFTEEWFVPYTFKVERSYKEEDFKMPPTPEKDPDVTEPITVKRSDTDTNGHANNASYIDWAIDCIPDEIYNDMTLKDLRVTYKKERMCDAKLVLNQYISDVESPLADRPEIKTGKQLVTVFTDPGNPDATFSKITMVWA